MISYDFQAGNYVEEYKNNIKWKDNFVEKLVNYIIDNDIKGSILEAGVGEATTLVPLLKKTKAKFNGVYGIDISCSRIKVAKDFIKENQLDSSGLVVGDLFCMPFKDNIIDFVYTCHAIEPNGGKEKEILQELYRVSKKYLILLEPAYELANEDARKRMLKHGYVTDLYNTAVSLGYNVVKYSLYGINANALNPTGMMIIKKDTDLENECDDSLCCPITKSNIEKFSDAYYAKESLLAYPIIGGVPCLTQQNAVVATKFLKYQI